MWDEAKLAISKQDLKREEEEVKGNGTYESRKEAIKIARRKLNRKIKTNNVNFIGTIKSEKKKRNINL